MKTLEQFITENGLTMTCRRVKSNPYMPGMARNFCCDIQNVTGFSSDFFFSQGSAHTADPTLADVLDCLASDANGSDESFESWCQKLGYDSDSRKAEATWHACRRVADKLKSLLGASYSELLYEVESR